LPAAPDRTTSDRTLVQASEPRSAQAPARRTAALMIPPDPGASVAPLLAWLKKVGGACPYEKAGRKWIRTLNIDSVLRAFGPTKLVVERSRGGQRVIRLVDVSWGDQWAIHYGVEFPHHAGRKVIGVRR
jgi:hypothetical protein